MTESNEMSTLWSVLATLHKKGYDTELLMTAKGLATEKGRLFEPGELKIIKTYRFEGASDPAEEAIIYVMEAPDGFIGYSIDAYGVYSNHADDGYRTLILKMVMKDRPEQQLF